MPISIEADSAIRLTTLLGSYFKEEILDGDNAFRCTETCNSLRSASKKLRLDELPRIAVIGLVRFDSNLQKISGHVQFENELDLGSYTGHDLESVMFDLLAIIVHQGESNNSGHYYAFVRSGWRWLKFDDSSVTEVTWDTVIDEEAYLLFYEQHNPTLQVPTSSAQPDAS